MSRQDDLNNLINNIAKDLDGFLGASIVDLDTGMSLASASKMANFDLDVASAYNSEMVKAKYKTIKALGLDTGLEDMLLTLDTQLHLIRMLDDQSFIYVAVDRDSSNLALLRSTVKRRISELSWSTLGKLRTTAEHSITEPAAALIDAPTPPAPDTEPVSPPSTGTELAVPAEGATPRQRALPERVYPPPSRKSNRTGGLAQRAWKKFMGR